MPWIRVEVNYFDHPKTLRFREFVRDPLADVYPVRLWAWVLKHAPTGDLSDFSNATIASASGFKGNPDDFVSALIGSGFLAAGPSTGSSTRKPGDILQVHDWEEYSGQYEKLTLQGRKRAERFRAKKSKGHNANVRVTSALRNGEVTQPEVEEEGEGKDLEPLDHRIAKSARADRRCVSYSASFLKFWEIYPRKVGKGAAYKSWNRLSPDTDLQSTLLDALKVQKSSLQWKKDGGQYIPHPTTWLNQRRWEDEPPETERSWVPKHLREAAS